MLAALRALKPDLIDIGYQRSELDGRRGRPIAVGHSGASEGSRPLEWRESTYGIGNSPV